MFNFAIQLRELIHHFHTVYLVRHMSQCWKWQVCGYTCNVFQSNYQEEIHLLTSRWSYNVNLLETMLRMIFTNKYTYWTQHTLYHNKMSIITLVSWLSTIKSNNYTHFEHFCLIMTCILNNASVFKARYFAYLWSFYVSNINKIQTWIMK